MSGTTIQLIAALMLCAVLHACGQAPATLEQTVAAITARLDADDLTAADDMIRAAIGQWPEEPQLRELQGDLDLKRGYGTRAQAAYERALIRAPASRVLRVKLARALMAQNRFREALGVAQPANEDSPEINGQLRLVRLEAGVALDATNFRAWREEAEALWRLAGSPPPGSDMRNLHRGLEQAAAKWEPIEAGRQHAQCKEPLVPARDAASDIAAGNLIRVGPAERLKTAAAAAMEATNGAVVEIADGSYDGDTVTWTQNNLTLRGRNGRPRLRLGGRGSSGSAIWVLRGDRIVVENVEFAAAAGGGADGTAIRVEGGDVVVRGSIFRGNTAAIVVTGSDPGHEVLITGSEFGGPDADGAGKDSGANRIEVGAIGKLTLEFSYLHGAFSGPGVSSRARVTRINYNRIAGGARGGTQRLIDLPEGGTAEIVGNEFESGGDPEPFAFIAFGAEGGGAGRDNALYVLSNTFHNRTPGSVAVSVGFDAPALVANNLFAGAPMSGFSGRAREGGNQSISGEGVGAVGFGLTRDSPAIDAAIDPRTLDADAPPVEFEYRRPGAGVARTSVWKPDAGAHEFCDSRFIRPSEPYFELPEG